MSTGLTASQQEAIAARGNIVVVAGAGTGKTRTLVERCLDCLRRETPAVSMDEILMVTFTEAAATEMRQRIRSGLEAELKARPGEAHWQEQLGLFETAHIGTLHSFCFELVRQHFYELELDPQLAVMPAEEASLLASEVIASVLQEHYSGRASAATSVQDLIQVQGRGHDQRVRALVLRLHNYSQSLPDPGSWFTEQQQQLDTNEPEAWRRWLQETLNEWPGEWLPVLKPLAASNQLAAQSLAQVQALAGSSGEAKTAALHRTVEIERNCPHGKKKAWQEPLADFFAEAKFLSSLVEQSTDGDPLAQDWKWVRSQTRALLDLAREFQSAFTEAKRELGMVDFHDLEQYALRLLWNPKTQQPTPIARQWREKLRFVFVDEYQDINAAQDKILEALGRDGAGANRFLVGDVKQSIYRFRLANPRIFQNYLASWRAAPNRTIALTENFRSRESILDFINSVFEAIMTQELGGVNYDRETALKFGAPGERRALARSSGSGPCVELHLRPKSAAYAESEDEEPDETLARLADLVEADKEARLVALRLLELKANAHEIWDETNASFRPVDWGDIAVLVRAPSGKAESYAKEFSRLGVPLQVVRGGFYQSTEISDIVNLLKLLDNPLQDIPAVAVLRSPLVGMSLDELAGVRLVQRHGPFFSALVKWNESNPDAAAPGVALPTASAKAATFLARFSEWRQLARQVSLSRCLQAILAQTHYDAWLLTQTRGQERHANVQRFLALARRFDHLQRQGLFRFLSYLEGQRAAESEPDTGPVAVGSSVRLMSIHRSKGLEFPVVVVADLAKSFNEADLRADLILDDKFGLCPQIRPPSTGRRYPSLSYWLARRRQRREMLGEELRLLYVAMTRARDTLILTATVPEKKLEGAQHGQGGGETPASARSYADWLLFWLARKGGLSSPLPRGENEFLRWEIHQDSSLLEPGAKVRESVKAGLDSDPTLQIADSLRTRFAWNYPFCAATVQPAKMTVSTLRRQAADLEEEAAPMDGPYHGAASRPARRFPQPAGASGEEVGKAHHKFLQWFSLATPVTREGLEAEARRLVAESNLAPEETRLLDFPGLLSFWQSELGQEIRAHADQVQRELAFTARFSPTELARFRGEPTLPEVPDEDFVVVQGIADLVIALPTELRLIDFKTDRVSAEGTELKARIYEPQLRLYAQALSRIYHRPVSGCWLYFLAASTAVSLLGIKATITPVTDH